MTDVYDHLGNDPNNWRSIAEALAYNARVLAEHRHQQQPVRDQYQRDLRINEGDMDFASLVLYGYAIECFLKCLYLKKGNRLAKDGELKMPTKAFKIRDLVQMADYIGFLADANSQQKEILKHLTIIVQWGGRYPVSTSSKKTSCVFSWEEPINDMELESLIGTLRRKSAEGEFLEKQS